MRAGSWPTAVVTGATSGIGRAVAQSLAAAGASVGIVARDPTRGEDARNGIAAATNNPRLEVFLADLSTLGSVRALADAIGRAYPSVDILVNCAAVFNARRTVTADGLELMFATNYLAPFLLTNLLLARLTAGVGGRVLTLTAPSTVRPDLDDLQSERRFSALNAFGASKAANLLFTYALARRLEGGGVTANAVHPGLVRSSLMRQGPAPLRWATWIFSHSPEEAADSIAPLATSLVYAETSGRFFRAGREIRSAPFTHEIGFQDHLWDVSAILAGLPDQEPYADKTATEK
jgi:NAD(P)-dependent dehydrogenase (short-subunit alcohol dehydrogenase family)